MAVFFLPTIQALEGTNLNGQTEILSVIASSVGKNYSIQISAYPETKINEATEFVSELRKRLPDVHMEKVYIQGQGVWNRILVGHFATFEEASLYMKEKKLFDVFPGSFVKLTSEG
jgi:cell division septation protein DedD